MKESLFTKYVTQGDRDYSILLLLTADSLMEADSLRLPYVMEEFQIAAKTYQSNLAGTPKETKIFFAIAELSVCRLAFELLNVQSLPYGALISPTAKIVGQKMTLPERDVMDVPSSYPWTAESFAEHAGSRGGVPELPIHRPSFRDSPFMPPIMAVALIITAVIAWKVYTSEFIKHPGWWIAGSCAVLWFATSGGMYNIIRNAPSSLSKRDGTIVWMLEGSGQLAVEGYAAGTLYLTFGLALAGVTHLGGKVHHPGAQRVALYGLLFLAFYTFSQLQHFYLAKTGMRAASFLF